MISYIWYSSCMIGCVRIYIYKKTIYRGLNKMKFRFFFFISIFCIFCESRVLVVDKWRVRFTLRTFRTCTHLHVFDIILWRSPSCCNLIIGIRCRFFFFVQLSCLVVDVGHPHPVTRILFSSRCPIRWPRQTAMTTHAEHFLLILFTVTLSSTNAWQRVYRLLIY